MSRGRILVTGASGFIGSRFCELARAAGYDVTAFMRPRQRSARYPAPDVVFGRLPYDVPERAWKDVDYVVHLAGATTGQDDAENHAINVEGTRVLLEQAKVHAKIKRFVFVSSQSAHKDAVSAYGKTKLIAEGLVSHSGLPYAIVRPGLVFGPGKVGLFYRMRRTVQKLPVLPLLGGGKALVQGVEVSDLGQALLKCLELPASDSPELNIGEPEAITLREFLQAIAVAETGKQKPALVVPLGPIKMVVETAEALHVPLPISSDNIKGMEMVRSMDTASSLAKLGVTLRPFKEAMAAAVREPEAKSVDPAERAVRMLLIGAGKIGIVHSLNLVEREGETLWGAADANPKAFNLYRSMGIDTEFIPDALRAIDELKPDAALVATPAGTHLPLARMCVERGLPVFVEKPVSFNRKAMAGWRELRQQHPHAIIHSGYMAAQYPHLQQARELIEAGALGKVTAVSGFSLQSHIMASKPQRWEMIRSKSGGGALLNFGSHTLSMILRLVGQPSSISGELWSLYSDEVEDGAELRMDYPDFVAKLKVCWSYPDYPRPENAVHVFGENGKCLVVRNYCTYLTDSQGRTEQVWTQQDYDLGYNAAPDYTGAGFSAEHAAFAAAVRGRVEFKPVELEEALGIEELIFDFYDSAANRGKLDRAPERFAVEQRSR